MTALHTSILLHCSAIMEPYSMRNLSHAFAPATQEYVEQLVNRGLIEVSKHLTAARTWPDPRMKVYVTTEKGREYVNRILRYATDGAPPLAACPPVIKHVEPRLRDECTFLQFFGTLRLPGWIWLLLGIVTMWRW